MSKLRITLLILLTVLSLVLCVYIAAPFLRPLAAAALLSVVFYPLHKHITRILPRPNVAAFTSTLLVLLIVIVPPIFLSLALQQELADMYRTLNAQSAQDGGLWPWFAHQLERFTAWSQRYPNLDLRTLLLERLQQWSNALLSGVARLVGDLASFVGELVIVFFTLFFLLRDGAERIHWLKAHAPLRAEQIEQLSTGVYRTIIASVYGGLAVALAQGALLTLAFWILGLPAPLLWGVVTGVFSLVPLVGSALIWLPAALALIVSGHWIKGLMLIAWGAGVVGLADNLVRPMIIHEQVRLSTIYLFFALLGGVQAFGLLGLIAGPVILAITETLIKLLWEESKLDTAKA